MIKLVAFDLDGTLTQHKSGLEAECRRVLLELSAKYKLLMVCAGGCKRVYSQMAEFPIDIVGFYGLERSRVQGGELTIINKTQIEHDRAGTEDRINRLRSELGYTLYSGDSVEYHDSGLITFPLLGTAAKLKDKLVFDPDRAIRRKIYKRVCEIFFDYNVFVGGSSSFDIAPKPYCKLYALEHYLQENEVERNELVYFGDDYGPGGNDCDIFSSGIRSIEIDDYREFPQIAREALL